MQFKSLKIILLSYIVIITLGAMLLVMPFSHYGDVNLIEALFTATSATCITGLIVISTPNDLTFFGQIILLSLIQIGGIGYMSLVTIFYLFVKNNLSVQEKSIAKESLSYSDFGDVHGYIIKVLYFVLAVELIGAVFLAIRFLDDMPMGKAIWFGVFHSISSFNNAGFSLFDDYFIGFNTDSITLLIVDTLIVLGGFGYLVLIELWQKVSKRHFTFSVHSKIVLYTSGWLLLGGVLLFLSLEYDNPKTLGAFGWYDKITNAFFYSVNLRSGGVNSFDVGAMHEASLFFSTIFMMIGAGPGSTGGGIKITTFVILIATVFFAIRGSSRPPHVFKRTIGFDLINKSLAIILTASFLVLVGTMLLVETQNTPFVKTLFEVVSAFATVGVSAGDGGVLSLSALFNDFGQLVIVAMMLSGRVGIFVFGLLIIGKEKKRHIEYPKGRILI